MKKAAVRAAEIESYLAYLWFEARGSELANSIRNAWQEALVATSIPRAFYVLPDASAISYLPPLSFALHIPFQLQKPYLSKDDCAFHLLDNPVRKDKVFQAPMVASTSWKGALRAALWQLGHKADHPVTIRLLGNPRESEEQQAGRLYFFPTFFDQIGLEVINPHDRNTGVGARGPILMECVPSGTKGEFLVLYVPFGTFGQDEAERRAEIAEDLQVLCMGVQSMLTTYGFGAKTSSGFGTAELVGEGRLTIRAALDGGLASSAPIAPPQPELPRYLETPTRLHTDFRREDGTLKSEAEYQALIESRGQKYAKRERLLYAKAKAWWEREGRALAQAPEPEPEPASPAPPPVSEYTFRSWKELHQAVQRGAELLEGGTA
ncbi:MAG: hypothetical protein N2049_11165 [Anaerolineales bacterium]|nr:hypothetical protein [Anaerolineales bacterium]